MGMIKITLNDKEYQGLHNDLALIQVKQMIDGKLYTKEIDTIKSKIKERYDLLKHYRDAEN
tara:strand:- start:297 stop:479 length:183 start_codon:yes stop_codon:yes gene_type:complete